MGRPSGPLSRGNEREPSASPRLLAAASQDRSYHQVCVFSQFGIIDNLVGSLQQVLQEVLLRQRRLR